MNKWTLVQIVCSLFLEISVQTFEPIKGGFPVYANCMFVVLLYNRTACPLYSIINKPHGEDISFPLNLTFYVSLHLVVNALTKAMFGVSYFTPVSSCY